MDSPNSPTNEGTSDAGKQNGATQKHKKGGQSSARQRYKMGKTWNGNTNVDNGIFFILTACFLTWKW